MVYNVSHYCDFLLSLTSCKGQKSPETEALRQKTRDGCEQLIFDFFGKERGQVAIYDANNGTVESRRAIGEKFEKDGIHIIFLGMEIHAARRSYDFCMLTLIHRVYVR